MGDDKKLGSDQEMGGDAGPVEKQRQKAKRPEALKQERKKLESETLNLSKEVGGLVDRLGRIKRSVARGSNETIVAN